MQESENADHKPVTAIIGLMGVALIVIGMSEMPPIPRVLSLAGGAVVSAAVAVARHGIVAAPAPRSCARPRGLLRNVAARIQYHR